MHFSYSPLKDEDYCQLDRENEDCRNRSVTKYIGCIQVNTSMRSLNPETRSEVAKESINRLCEATKLKKFSSTQTAIKRQEHIGVMLADQPNLIHSGTKVQLCVTSTHLNVVSCDSKEIIIQHEMPNVSFASSGDEDTVDFVAYVAKDTKFGRACFVLECGYEMAKNVLATIGRAFQLRTQQILSNNASTLRTPKTPTISPPATNSATLPTTGHNFAFDTTDSMEPPKTPKLELAPNKEHMISAIRASLENEEWYHGAYLTREDSESRLKQDGDFLVRESLLCSGQFVLSAMQDGVKRHLLLVDPMGIIRTKEMMFDNISHLVSFHRDKFLPIVSAEGVLYLRNGVRPPPSSKLSASSAKPDYDNRNQVTRKVPVQPNV